MYRFFVKPEQIGGEQIQIVGADVNHIKNVLRMKPGEKVRVSDGQKMDYFCEVESLQDEQVIVHILTASEGDTELPAEIVLYQGLPKGDKLEWIIQKAVELGVSQIVPVAMKYSVVKIEPKKEEAKRRRWNMISESAAKQSKRLIVPEVGRVLSYKKCIQEMAALDMVLVPYESAEGMESLRHAVSVIKPGMRIGIVIGPEGGFAEEEIEEAKAAGAVIVSLGKRILRTETAGLAMLSILMYHMEIGINQN